MKPPHNISIVFADIGCQVHVGCKSLCYADNQQMLIDLAAYVNDPKATIKLMQEQHPGLHEKEPRGLYQKACEEVAAMAQQGLNSPSFPFPRD